MMKCYFIGHKDIYDEGLAKKLAIELEKLVQLDDALECWFYTYTGEGYFRLCTALAIWLRTKYPHKQITIIKAFDARDGLAPNREYSFEIDGDFPRCMADKNVYVPLVDRCHDKSFMYYINRVDHWLIKQCDYLFVYCYPEAERKIYNQSLCTKEGATVIRLDFAQTQDLIQEERLRVLSDRDRSILRMLEEKRLTHEEIAQAVGLSKKRVAAISGESGDKLRQALAICAPKPSTCAVLALTNLPVIADALVLFACMVDYLIKSGVTTFYLDDAIGMAAYEKVLDEAISNHAGKADILVKRCTTPDYAAIIQESQWVLADFAHEQAETIKALCQEDGQTLLIDLGRDKRRIERLFQ